MVRTQAAQDATALAQAWQQRSELLERERLLRLRALSEYDAAQLFARLLSVAAPYPLHRGSGLVEQQRIFSRLRAKS
jgi:hypothetical protein